MVKRHQRVAQLQPRCEHEEGRSIRRLRRAQIARPGDVRERCSRKPQGGRIARVCVACAARRRGIKNAASRAFISWKEGWCRAAARVFSRSSSAAAPFCQIKSVRANARGRRAAAIARTVGGSNRR